MVDIRNASCWIINRITSTKRYRISRFCTIGICDGTIICNIQSTCTPRPWCTVTCPCSIQSCIGCKCCIRRQSPGLCYSLSTKATRCSHIHQRTGIIPTECIIGSCWQRCNTSYCSTVRICPPCIVYLSYRTCSSRTIIFIQSYCISIWFKNRFVFDSTRFHTKCIGVTRCRLISIQTNHIRRKSKTNYYTKS